MARVKQNPQENYNKPLAVRLRQLIEEKQLSKFKLATEIGISRQAINDYTLGNSVPDSNNLTKIAEYFRVSADYLLGLSDLRNPKISEYSATNLGFSEKAINQLEMLKEVSPRTITVINWLIENEFRFCDDTSYGAMYCGEFLRLLAEYFSLASSCNIPYLRITTVNATEREIEIIGKENVNRIVPNSKTYPIKSLLSTDVLGELKDMLKLMQYEFSKERHTRAKNFRDQTNIDIQKFDDLLASASDADEETISKIKEALRQNAERGDI